MSIGPALNVIEDTVTFWGQIFHCLLKIIILSHPIAEPFYLNWEGGISNEKSFLPLASNGFLVFFVYSS